MSANVHGIFALTGRAHCQRQVAFFCSDSVSALFICHMDMTVSVTLNVNMVQVKAITSEGYNLNT